MAELKPCPFCGHVGLDFTEGSTFRWGVASCSECGASCGETRKVTMEKVAADEWHGRAIEAWNRRTLADEASSAVRDAAVWCGCGDQIMPNDGVQCGTCAMLERVGLENDAERWRELRDGDSDLMLCRWSAETPDKPPHEVADYDAAVDAARSCPAKEG